MIPLQNPERVECRGCTRYIPFVTEHAPSWARQLPNRLSMSRLLLVPVLLTTAWFRKADLFLLLFAVSLFTDFLDGFLARRLQAQSEWGARLDSWADACSWICFTCCAMWLWPQKFEAMQLWIGTALICFLIPGLYGLVKYHRLPGFHTYSAKLAMAGMGVAVLLYFGWDRAWLLQLSVVILGVVCAEETLMVHWLSEPRTDLRSAFQAYRLRPGE